MPNTGVKRTAADIVTAIRRRLQCKTEHAVCSTIKGYEEERKEKATGFERWGKSLPGGGQVLEKCVYDINN